MKGSLEQMRKVHVEHRAVNRPWLQAFMWRSPEFGPKYLYEETKQAESSGGVGWLMWNPGEAYPEAWRGMPIVSPSAEGAKSGAVAPAAPRAPAKPVAHEGTSSATLGG